MRDGWTDTTLGDIAEYINGYPFKPGDLGDDGTAVIRIKQLLDPMEKVDRTTVDVPERCVLSNGDIVFSWSGTLAVRVWNRGTAYLNQHLFRVIEKTGVSHEWLPLVIDHAIEDLVEKSHGTTMKHITKQTLLPHQVFLPPLVEQKRIVDLVASVDAYIDALRHQVDTARTAFLAICEEIFSTGEDMKPLHEVATVIMGQSPEGSTCNTDGTGTPLLAGPTEFTKRTVGPPRQWTSKETKLSQSGDILFCVRGATAGRINIGNYRSVIGRGLAAVRCNNTEDTNLVRFALMVGLGQLLPAAGGTIFPNISQSQLRNFEVSWPSEIRRAELSELVRSIEEVVLRTEQAVEDAKNLRSGLLSDLLSGEHEIPESYDVFVGAA